VAIAPDTCDLTADNHKAGWPGKYRPETVLMQVLHATAGWANWC